MKYSKPNNTDFFLGLKSRIELYFNANKIDKYANKFLIFKGTIILLIYAVAYGCFYFIKDSLYFLMLAYTIVGLSGVMIVYNIVHDASHHAISRTKKVNNALCYLGDLVGLNTYIWNLRHNIQHHSFTNVLGGDLIIDGIPMIRMSEHQKFNAYHRFQKYYAPFFYMFYSIYWIMVFDINLFLKKDICNLKNIKHPKSEWLILIFSKLFYITYMIILPTILTPYSLMQIIACFFVMHVFSGLLLSFIAVLGHFVEGPSFPEPENGIIDNSWSEHELETTIDFAPGSRVIGWITGGLNTHVAHHLFPNICHVHYYKITRIIESYCKENNYAYKKDSFLGGMASHFRYLDKMSKPVI